MCGVTTLLPAFRHLTGEKVNICRLCFAVVDNGTSLDDVPVVECLFYDKSVCFAEMLIDLGVPTQSTLPHFLCEYCSELTVKAFLFKKLSQYSNNKWNEAIERLNTALNSADTYCTGIKTAFILIHKDSNKILIGRKTVEKSKEGAIKRINLAIRRQYVYETTHKNKYTICSQCGEKVHRRSLCVHIKQKHTRKIVKCPSCHQIFKDANQLRDHKERVHLPKTIPCPKCDKMFSTMRLIRIHEGKYHKAVICKLCSKEFTSRDILNRHIPTHNLHKCTHCLKQFKNKITLTRHMRRHSANHAFVICDICKKQFVDKRGLTSHMATEHGFGGTHTCDWCNKRFDAASRLKAHVVKHTKEKSFSCDTCGGVFVTKAALHCHMRIHTGEKPFSCQICGEKFLNASRRTAHLRRMHLDPQYSCSACDSKFYTKTCLNKHFARHKDPQSKLFISEL